MVAERSRALQYLAGPAGARTTRWGGFELPR
jgi:hypothetical protein